MGKDLLASFEFFLSITINFLKGDMLIIKQEHTRQ